MEEKKLDLEEIRGEIDAVNQQLLQLLIKRLKLCSDVAEYKKERGLPIYVPEREKAILEWAENAAGPQFAPYASRFFEHIMQLGRDYENGVIGGAESGKLLSTRPDALLTERLIILPLEPGDVKPVYSIVSDAALMDSLNLSPKNSEEEALQFIRTETEPPCLAFKVLLKGTSQFAGLLLLKPDPDSMEKVLLSVVFFENCWHQGYLTELIPMAEKIAVDKLGAKSIWGYVPDEKLYALRAFFKAGYQVNSVLSLPDRSFQVICRVMENPS